MLELSSNEVLRLFNKKARSTLTDWRKLGAKTFEISKAHWDATGLLQWWCENIYLPRNNEDLSESRERWEKARAEKLEIEVARMKGDSLPRKEMEEALVEMLTLTKNGFMALPRSAPATLYGMTEVEMMTTLEKMVHTILENMARMADLDEIEKKLKAIGTI